MLIYMRFTAKKQHARTTVGAGGGSVLVPFVPAKGTARRGMSGKGNA